MSSTIAAILDAHRTGAATPAATIAACYARIRAHGDPAVFISLRDEEDALAQARALAAQGSRDRPLYGIPVAVKDNIDVARSRHHGRVSGLCLCPRARTQPAVARLQAAGAIIIGKTNLDQFATGLVGVRSPYGIPRNALHGDAHSRADRAAGSAVAVAAGLVPLALGTDTAGSGRVPAGLNNIVGLKAVPRPLCRTRASYRPAERSIASRCSRLRSRTRFTALSAMAGYDDADPYSRPRRPRMRSAPCRRACGSAFHSRAARRFGGDELSGAAFDAALAA